MLQHFIGRPYQSAGIQKVVKSQIQSVSPYPGTRLSRKIPLIPALFSKYKCRDKGSHFKGVRASVLKILQFYHHQKTGSITRYNSEFRTQNGHSRLQKHFYCVRSRKKNGVSIFPVNSGSVVTVWTLTILLPHPIEKRFASYLVSRDLKKISALLKLDFTKNNFKKLKKNRVLSLMWPKFCKISSP